MRRQLMSRFCFFSSRRRHTRYWRDWSSDVCSSDLKRLHDDFGVQVVGCPKTIDNDLSATDTTFGYDTAVAIATEAIDRVRTTARSHERVMVVEIMGRHAGWITWGAGVAGAANITLIPEVEPDMRS